MSKNYQDGTQEPATETTVAIFGVDRESVVFALFPELPEDHHGFYCTCYQQVGQHCAADYYGCIANSRPATLAEYADLFVELQRRGYEMKIRRRASSAMHERRRQSATVG